MSFRDEVRDGIERLHRYIGAHEEVGGLPQVRIVVEWDTDDFDVERFVEIPAELYALNQAGEGHEVADWLSDKYGYAVNDWRLDF